MNDIERMAAIAAEHVNGGKFVSGDFYSPEHRQRWIEAMTLATERLREHRDHMRAVVECAGFGSVTEALVEIDRLRAEVARLVKSRNKWGQKYNRTFEKLKAAKAGRAEAVEVMRSCRATYVENDDASALERIIDKIDTFLAKREGRSGE